MADRDPIWISGESQLLYSPTTGLDADWWNGESIIFDEYVAEGGASAVPANRGNVGMALGMSNAMWLDNDFLKPLGGN